MQEERIRLTSTDSANSVNRDAFVDVEIQHHTKVFPFPSVSNTIDQRELFEQERENSKLYRLILTINPYCTNVLFNAVSEIVKNEGTDKPSDLIIATADGQYGANSTSALNDITNIRMIRNTMYSNQYYDFKYHCGYDIFNNHILRNQSFKLVNPLTDKSFKYQNTSGLNKAEVELNYNTIEDIMRYADGTEVVLKRRTSVKEIQGVNSSPSQNWARHLYLKDDILGFADSINANLSEVNGWFGFYNRSSIPACEFNDLTKEWDDMNIAKIFDGKYFDGTQEQEHMACEFIELYPDSSLYSFNPKYNLLQNREEQNWDICITYPYKSFGLNYDNEEERGKLLINGILKTEEGKEAQYFNALLLADYKQSKGSSGQDILIFRSYVKHNLKRGDKFKLYYKAGDGKSQDGFTEIEDRVFEVVNTGNVNQEYLDYYFYINDVNDIKQILGLDINENIPEHSYAFRFTKVINDRNCKYYFRKFRKLPNFKFKREELTDDVLVDEKKFEEYITKNCRKTSNSEMLPFNKEQYPLAFSRTIYNDANTQIVFTDSLDLSILTDNLGRPLTELFVTIIKRNKGHDIWYKKTKTENELRKIEFSHCFGNVTSGLVVHGEWSDDDTTKDIRKEIGDCCLITNTDGTSLDENITIEDKNHDIVFGDVVELDTYNMKETVLSDVHFRFNTEQREHDFKENELQCNKMIYDEIMGDDYDYDYYNEHNNKSGWHCDHNDCDDINEEAGAGKTTYRPEGYHYKAHYPIKVREFGSFHQASHKDIRITQCRPKQANGMFIEVVSSIRSGVNGGDMVYLCDDATDDMIPLTVNTVQSNVRFLLNPMKPTDDGYKNIFEIVQGLLYSEQTIDEGERWIDEDGNENIAEKAMTVNDYGKPKYVLRLKNDIIPRYAYKVATNVYIWRDVLNVGHKDTVELKEYPFANGHFYINKEINFFLERQDQFGREGLYNKEKTPIDVFGNIRKTSNYEYKDEKHRVC